MAYNVSNELGLDTVLGGDDLTGSDEYQLLLQAARDLQNAYTQDRQARNDAVGMDMDTLGRIERVATGAEPSLAEQLARKAVQQSASQSVGLAATLGGANPGAALRAGYEAQADAPSQSAAELEALRAREMDAARALFAQQTGRAHATDVAQAQGTGNTYAGIAGAPFGAMSQDAAAQAAREAAILQAGATGVSAYQKNNPPAGVPKYETYDPFATPSDIRGKTDVQPSPGMADDFLRSLAAGPSEAEMRAPGYVPTANDPRSIENPRAISGAAADDFLSTLHPQSYKYKNPDGVNKQPGTRMGVMAQDLPDHDVITDPSGRKWISADVISDVLAGMGRLNEKVDAKTGASGRGGRASDRQNIDLNTRPRVTNPDGSVSTIRSMGVNIDGKEVLIPTISDDGRVMTEREAVQQYKRTGKHLGRYGSVAESNAAAQALHDAEARSLQRPPSQEIMIPQSAVHDYLAGLGIVPP